MAASRQKNNENIERTFKSSVSVPYTGFFLFNKYNCPIKYKKFAKCLFSGKCFFRSLMDDRCSKPINVQCGSKCFLVWCKDRRRKKEEIQDETETSLAVY